MITQQLIDQLRVALDAIELSLDPSPEILDEEFKAGDDLYANLDNSKSTVKWTTDEDIQLAKALKGLVRLETKDHSPKMREIIAVRLVKGGQLNRTEKAVINRIHSAMKSYYEVGPPTVKRLSADRIEEVKQYITF